MTITDTDLTLTVTETGRTVIANILLQAQAVEQAWAYTDPKLSQEVTTSALRRVAELFTGSFSAQTTISRDGADPLSLYAVGGIHFGVIFHAKHYHVSTPQEMDQRFMRITAPREGRYCAHQDDKGPACLKPYFADGRMERGCEHPRDVPAWIMPIPGTWSFHS